MSALRKLESSLQCKFSDYQRLQQFLAKEVTVARVSLETYLDLLDKAQLDEDNYAEAVILSRSFIESVERDVDIETLEGTELLLKDEAQQSVADIFQEQLSASNDFMRFYQRRYPLSNRRGLRVFQRNIDVIENVYMKALIEHFRLVYRRFNMERYIVQHLIYGLGHELISLEEIQCMHGVIQHWLTEEREPDVELLTRLNLSIDILINYELHDNFNQKLTRFFD